MPNDQLRDARPLGLCARSTTARSAPGCRSARVGLSLNLNRVSDDNYWRDFSRATASLTQRLLANDGALTWARGDFSVMARALKWQTLQDVTAPIVPPYDRLPQIDGALQPQRPGRRAGSFRSKPTTPRFEADPLLTRPAQRPAQLYAGADQPALAGAGLVRHPQAAAARDAVPVRRRCWPTAATRPTASVPTFSLDSGLVFERDASFFGRSFRQTLEPRAFYVYTPFRDQNLLPNYDSAAQRLQLRHHLHRERVRRQRPHLRQQPADAGRQHPAAGPGHRRRSGALRHRPAAALQGPAGHLARRRAGQRAAVATCCSAPRSTGRRSGASTPRCSTTRRPSRSIRSTRRRRATAPATTA